MIKLSFKKKKRKKSSIRQEFLSARDAVEDGESPNSCEDDTSTSDSDDSLNDSSTHVEESFEVMFVLEEEIQQVT